MHINLNDAKAKVCIPYSLTAFKPVLLCWNRIFMPLNQFFSLAQDSNSIVSNWVIPIFKILGWWGWTLTWFYLLFEEHIKYWWWTTFFFFFQKRFFCVPCSWKSFFARENESKPASKDQSEQHTVFTLLKAEMRQTFYRHTREKNQKWCQKSRRFFLLTYLMSLLHLLVQK